jgi:hypothetical protein
LMGVEEDEVSSESDSGTGSKCSFFRAQVQRAPWLQQQSVILLVRKLLSGSLRYLQ